MFKIFGAIALGLGLLSSLSINFVGSADAQNGINQEEANKKQQEIIKMNEGKRKHKDYHLKIKNQDGEVVWEGSSNYYQDHRGEIENKYNLVPDNAAKQAKENAPSK